MSVSHHYWLGKLQGVLKVPRPASIKKDPKQSKAFKEHLYEKLVGLQLDQSKKVRIWVVDETRYGLHSIYRRCWGLKGVRVVKAAQQKYTWGYCLWSPRATVWSKPILLYANGEPATDRNVSEANRRK